MVTTKPVANPTLNGGRAEAEAQGKVQMPPRVVLRWAEAAMAGVEV